MNKLFLNDKFILLLILINTFIIFISGFNFSDSISFTLKVCDNTITILFLVELFVKFKEYGLRKYFESNWNRFDFTLIVLSIPTLVVFFIGSDVGAISFLLVFRVMRVFKSFRFLKFIPNIEHLIKGINRALKSSILVIVAFVIYIFINGIFSFYLFKGVSSELFGNPLNSIYSIFKVFTLEGWYEIPQQLTLSLSDTMSFFVYLYFIFIVITGGVFGLSLMNSIFVDAMVSDNNDDLELKVDSLEKKIEMLIKTLNK